MQIKRRESRCLRRQGYLIDMPFGKRLSKALLEALLAFAAADAALAVASHQSEPSVLNPPICFVHGKFTRSIHGRDAGVAARNLPSWAPGVGNPMPCSCRVLDCKPQSILKKLFYTVLL